MKTLIGRPSSQQLRCSECFKPFYNVEAPRGERFVEKELEWLEHSPLNLTCDACGAEHHIYHRQEWVVVPGFIEDAQPWEPWYRTNRGHLVNASKRKLMNKRLRRMKWRRIRELFGLWYPIEKIAEQVGLPREEVRQQVQKLVNRMECNKCRRKRGYRLSPGSRKRRSQS